MEKDPLAVGASVTDNGGPEALADELDRFAELIALATRARGASN
jgi:hypothetical protein